MTNTYGYREYLFSRVNDADRLQIEHSIHSSNFRKKLELILDGKYGLSNRFLEAEANGEKVYILDLGCGEGLYLQDVAQLLEERGLADKAVLVGLDIDKKAISQAIQLAKKQQAAGRFPSAKLTFFVQDVTQPLNTHVNFKYDNLDSFDLIFANQTLELLPSAKELLGHYYSLLNKGGVIYSHSVSTKSGEDGWISPHPVLEPFAQIAMGYIASMNNGFDVAVVAEDWLEELGAELVESSSFRINIGGTTQEGLQMLRDVVYTMRNVGPQLIAQGLVSQRQFDEAMTVLFRELGPDCQAHWTFYDVLGRKS